MNKNIIIVLLIFGFGLAGGVLIAQTREEPVSENNQSIESDNQVSTTGNNINDLVTYNLPDNFKEVSCSGESALYVVEGNNEADCASSPDSAITLSISGEKINDCNQLQDRKEVKKHVCISLFINDQRSLQSTTEYLASSSFGKDISSQEYYIDTGKEIVLARYLYTGNGTDQEAFEAIVNSLKTK